MKPATCLHFIENSDVLILGHPRSGTHFLQSSLVSHPGIHGRGECFLRYQRFIKEHDPAAAKSYSKPFIFNNKPGCLNLAILSYQSFPFFDRRLGRSLFASKIIHLIRDPFHVATSLVQMEADRTASGDKFKAHYRVNESLPVSAPISREEVKAVELRVTELQGAFRARLESHPHVMTVSYDEVTKNCQVNQIPENHARQWLDFLGLNYLPLVNTLKKTGPQVLPIKTN
jgi:hypothetical protein